MAVEIVAVSLAGRALGEDSNTGNPVKLTNRDVQMMRRLRQSDPAFWTYRMLGEKFEVSKRYAEKVCKYERRCQAPSEYRRRRKGS